MKVAAIGLLALALTQTSAAQPVIYRCVGESGGLVYSDRPCSVDAEQHEIDDGRVTVYVAPPASQSAPRAAAVKADSLVESGRGPFDTSGKRRDFSRTHRPKAGRATVSALEQHQIKCAKLDRSLRDVRSKMRTGYGVKEGERLKARQRQLTEQRRTQKCG